MKYEEFEQKSLLISREIGQTKLDIEKQVDTLKFENQKLLHMSDSLKKDEENIEKIKNKITKINERMKNIEKIIKSDNFKYILSECKSKSKKKVDKEKDINTIKEFDIQVSLDKSKRKRNSLLIENRGKNSFLIRSPKKNGTNKHKKRSSIRDIKDFNIFENDINNKKKDESSNDCTLKQIKILSLDNNETKEERKHDNDNKINNIFSSEKIEKENEINIYDSILKLKSEEINNNNIINKLLVDKPKDDFKLIKNEINFDIKEENGKDNKIIQEKQDSQSFKSEESSISKTSINQSKSESLNNKGNKIEKEIIQNYLLDNRDNNNKSKSNKILNFINNKENVLNNTQ